MATGFILQGVNGINYSFGTNHIISKGWFFTRGRPVGFRQNLSGNTFYDRFSLRVAKCSIVSNTSIHQVNAGGQRFKRFIGSSGNYNASYNCPGDSFTLSISTYGSEFISIDKTIGKIIITPHVNRIR